MSRRHRPSWGSDGQPTNLAAAAQDALEWLRLFAETPRPQTTIVKVRRDPVQMARLHRCMDALHAFLSQEENTTV